MTKQWVCFWHLKALGYCNRKMRLWCKEHGVSWRELRLEGIAADRLLALDDTIMARNAVTFAASTGWAKEPAAAKDNDRQGGCV